MRLFRIATIIMVAVTLLVPAVGAQEIENGNYLVTPAGEAAAEVKALLTPTGIGGIVMPTGIGDSITQGETDYFSIYVPVGTTELIVDLNWGDTSDSLRLIVYAPDAVLGPYYDAADNKVDGRIYLSIKNGAGAALCPGTWQFSVYGDRVTGTQGYTFVCR